MKKTLLLSFLASAVIGAAALEVGETFQSGGLYYQVTSLTPPEVGVAPHPQENYMGSYNIPASVSQDGETYTVTSVLKFAFDEANYVNSVTLPNTVTYLAMFSFDESGIRSINIPASVKTIDKWAFSACPYLNSVTLEGPVDSIGMSAFDSCEQLKEFTFPEGTTHVGTDVLCDCSALEKVTFAGSMDSIPENAVWGCKKLEIVTIPEGIKRISDFAFNSCYALEEINLPSSLTRLDRFAFAYNTALRTSPLTENIDTMGHGVLFMCAALTEVNNFPSAMDVIPDGMFQGCTGLLNFTVSDKVKYIEQDAFYYCFGLQEITIGKNVRSLGAKSFYIPAIDGEHDLMKITCLAENPPLDADQAGWDPLVYEQTELYVPADAVAAYKAAPGWENFKNIKPIGPGSVQAIDLAEGEVEIYDLQGRSLFRGLPADSSLPSGVYIVRSADGSTSKIRL